VDSVSFDRWAENEPSRVTKNLGSDQEDVEDCVVSNWGYAGQWNDLPCKYTDAYFACSMKHEQQEIVSGIPATDSPIQPEPMDPNDDDFYTDTEILKAATGRPDDY
jgi:hypothetical protein